MGKQEATVQHDQTRIPTKFQAAIEADMRRIVVAFQPVRDALVDTANRLAYEIHRAQQQAGRRG